MSEPKYFEDLFNAAETLRKYEAAYEKATGYNKWMLGRREGEYDEFVSLQIKNVHQLAVVINGFLVCVCGLITEIESDSEGSPTALLSAPGHWNHVTGAPITSGNVGGSA